MKGLETGSRAATAAEDVRGFLDQHASPLFYGRTDGAPDRRACREVLAEEHFWREEGRVLLGAVELRGFRVTDWFPRAPGVYWSRYAEQVREYAWSSRPHVDRELGGYFSPRSKMGSSSKSGLNDLGSLD